MAQAQFKKTIIASKASKLCIKYDECIAKKKADQHAKRDEQISILMKPKWWRKSLTYDQAMAIVIDREITASMYGWSFGPSYSELRLEAQRLLYLAEECHGEFVTLDEKEVEFLGLGFPEES